MAGQRVCNWDAVDWKRPNRDIMRELNLPRATVTAARKRYAPNTVGKVRAPVGKVAWQSVDWNRPTRDIAIEQGVGPASVGWARKRYAPETVGKFQARRAPKIDWSAVRWDRNDHVISRDLGVANVTVWRYRQVHAPETVGAFKFIRGTVTEMKVFRVAFAGRPVKELLAKLKAEQLARLAETCALLREAALAALRKNNAETKR